MATSEASDATRGVYLHVPFCERVCPYCDFAVVAARPLTPRDEARYVDALLRELDLRRGELAGRELRTIYFGGGTPSLLAPTNVKRLIDAIRSVSEPAAQVEVTLELNPTTSPREHLAAFRASGVNRLSIGIESFDDAKLKSLGRGHAAAANRATLQGAREAGFANVSIDLMFRAPNESLADFERDLEAFAESGADHISAYELTIEEGTPFGAALDAGRLPARVVDDDAADMTLRIEERLGVAGYHRYELSAYARPGFEAVHNQRYWERAPVVGLGMSAWSNAAPSDAAPFGARSANARALSEYLEAVESGRNPTAQRETLSPESARSEAIFLGLRRAAGVDAARFAREFGASLRSFFDAEIERLLGDGLIAERPNGDLILTPRGRLLADGVASVFV